jgi:hypothetical protein
VIPRVPKIMKVQAGHANRRDYLRPSGHLVEVAPPQRAAGSWSLMLRTDGKTANHKPLTMRGRMAKFMLIKISLMAEITDADALREAALKNFDAADMTSTDHPDTADWHASEEGQEERRLVATQDRDALTQFVDPAKACEMLDGVPASRPCPWARPWANWKAPRSARPATPG